MLADIRFKLLAFVPLIAGGSAAFLTAANLPHEISLALSIFGFIVTLGITICNVRNSQLMNLTCHRAKQLEKLLPIPGVGQFSAKAEHIPCFGCIRLWADFGLALIYGTALAAWVFLILDSAVVLIDSKWDILRWRGEAGAALLAVVVGLVLVKEILRMDRWAKNQTEEAIGNAVQENL